MNQDFYNLEGKTLITRKDYNFFEERQKELQKSNQNSASPDHIKAARKAALDSLFLTFREKMEDKEHFMKHFKWWRVLANQILTSEDMEQIEKLGKAT